MSAATPRAVESAAVPPPPASAPAIPPIEALDALAPPDFEAAVGPLFEGAPAFLGRLAAARPFVTVERLFARAREIAHAMPTADQLELIDAHPRLGAPADTVSAASFIEQGYDREAAQRAAHDADEQRAQVAAELDRLNTAYEARFGFRYCVFVAGRPRAALLPDMAAALLRDRDAEIDRALDAVIDIATDRHARARSEAVPGRPRG